MEMTRREFVAAGLAGLAGVCTGSAPAADTAPASSQLPAEDGYKLWLRYAPPGDAAKQYRDLIHQIVVEGESATANIVGQELALGAGSMLGSTVPAAKEWTKHPAIIAGTPAASPLIGGLGWNDDLAKLGPEGFIVRATKMGGVPVVIVASQGEVGALYGAFHLLRLMQTAQSIAICDVAEKPRMQLRLLNHWDNLNGAIERGYAGRSLWHWADLPDKLDPRYVDYARANASIGVNGAVINNVNADPKILATDYLKKAAALANVWRPYGVRMYLSVNFAAPVTVGRLATADPREKSVADWWKTKADEIYALMPDFGGFLVKANSEGQPGPKDYGLSHADGANVMADALAPHQGFVIWRAFVYDESVDPDRAKRAYKEFMPLDGKFRPNAIVQVKNGPVDFQPREPFHPLFGGLKKTSVVAEVQASQEYLGQARHLVYLGTMWKEFLDADTFANGKGSTVGRTLEIPAQAGNVTGMVSVTNPGLDRNWCGHHFSQSNWYAFGRLAWNHELSAEDIAGEWTRMTFTTDPATVETIRAMMMGSRETFLNYTMPLGLHHMIGGNHYAPAPANSGGPRKDWTAVYYHQASGSGIGFDRTKTGDQAVEQYYPPVCDLFNSLETCPETFLLWFHRCAWDYKMKSGQTLWRELCLHYYRGAERAAALRTTWQSLASKIDPQRHKEVDDRLAIQVQDAAAWRDMILQYFATFSKLPIEA